MKGMIAVVLLNLVISFQRLSVKYLYNQNPNMDVLQLLIYRAIIAFCFNVLWLNVKLKDEMYTTVRRELIGNLAAKVAHS